MSRTFIPLILSGLAAGLFFLVFPIASASLLLGEKQVPISTFAASMFVTMYAVLSAYAGSDTINGFQKAGLLRSRLPTILAMISVVVIQFCLAYLLLLALGYLMP